MERRLRTLAGAWLGTYRSPNTRDAYERDLAAFARWCTGRGTSALRARPEDLDRYRDECLAAGSSASTVSRRLSGLASFFRFAAERGALATNPADAVDRPEPDASASPVLDDAEVGSLLDAADALGPKTAALIALLALDGMKLGEVLAIDVPRVRIDGPAVSVDLQRRSRPDAVQVAPRTAEAVTAYVAGRRRGPLFVGESPVATSAARLSRFGADFLIKRAVASAGIEKAVSASVLRRSYIDSANRAGTPLAEIAEHVGHREVRETARLLEPGG